MDLQSGYRRIALKEEEMPKKPFITKYGRWEYTRLPFGLCNAPSTFQRCMKLIFRGMQWKTLLIYLDDTILYSSNMNDNFTQLEEIFNKLKKAGLKLKPSEVRSAVFRSCGGKDGVKPNSKIVESVQNWKVPTNVKEVQKFLGLCNYYRRFIQGFSEKASCLTNLIKKGVDFVWSEECQRQLLETDASNIGIGCV